MLISKNNKNAVFSAFTSTYDNKQGIFDEKELFYAIHNPLHKPCLQVPRVYLFLFKMPAKTANHDQSSYFQLLNYAEVISLSCTIFVCKQCS